jgi:hypothetical protein
MLKAKSKEEVKVEKPVDGHYKGYQISQLRKELDHPDYYIVKEYDDLMEKGVSK